MEQNVILHNLTAPYSLKCCLNIPVQNPAHFEGGITIIIIIIVIIILH
jgi:hypothetical protein